MAFENVLLQYTVAAGGDMTGTGYQYHAVCLEDGAVAAGAYEASGILLNKPPSGGFAEIGLVGIMKYASGVAVTAGDRLTVTTSGWFKGAGSGDFIVGTGLNTTTSGSIGTGLFDFSVPVYAFSSSFAK